MTTLRLALVMLVAVVVQVTVFVDFRVFGVAPELLVLVAVIVGYLTGPKTGSTAAFVIGLLWDIYLPTPLGLAAIVFAVVAYGVASVKELLNETTLQFVVIVAFGTFSAITGYALLGEVMGQRGLVNIEMLRVALVATLLNALAAPMVRPLLGTAMHVGTRLNR